MKKLNIMITGASRGIGLTTAKVLAKQGHNLALFDIADDTLTHALTDDVFKQTIAQNGLVQGHLDVSNVEDWDAALEQTLQQLSGIDVLINNAGVLVSGELPETDVAKQLKLVDINCQGVLIGCHKVAQHLQNNPYSKIINLSSASAIYGQPEIAVYSASKFFVRGLTEALNVEYKARGIKVVDVMPLWVASDMTKDVSVTSMDRLGLNLTPMDVAKILSSIATKPNNKVRKTHYPVGMPAKILHGLSQVTPDSLGRYVNAAIGAK